MCTHIQYLNIDTYSGFKWTTTLASEKADFVITYLLEVMATMGIPTQIKMDKVLGQRKGYGTDALKTIVHYAFNEMRLNCIYADVLEYNVPSQKLFEKCSFSKDGVLRSRIYKNGGYQNIISYSPGSITGHNCTVSIIGSKKG